MRRAALWSCDLRLAERVAAADRVHDARCSLFLELRDDEAVGMGECATSSTPGADPTTDQVVGALDRLIRAGGLDETPPDATTPLTASEPASSPAERAARALFDAAHLDLALRCEGRSLASALGVTVDRVAYAGVVGTAGPNESAARASALVAAGAQRVRVKHTPGAGVATVTAVLDAVDVPVVVDANGSMDPRRDRDELAALAAMPIAWLEQPFAPGDIAAHAELARSGVAVGLDESVTSRDVVEEAARLGAATVCCVKPARVGGLGVAIAIRDAASSLGLATYVGGFFEAGLGRAVLAALAAAPTPGSLAGDVVGPASYLVEDPCRLAAPEGGLQPLHTDPGCGPHPAPVSLELVRRYPV